MKTKFILPRLLMLVVFGFTLHSCTSNEDEMQPDAANVGNVEVNAAYLQKDNDTLTVNGNEPVIVRPPR